MRTKLIALAGVLLLVAACETTPEETGDTGAAGLTTPPPDTTTTAEPQMEEQAMAVPRGLSAQEQLVQEVGDRVFFEFDRSTLRPDGEATLRRQAEFLLANPGLSITLAGHADERGTREYNLALGERRANAAKNYLVSLGVDPGRINTVSYGKERPIVLGHNEAAWAQNRVAVAAIN